jgi:hypothetical protein
MLTETEYSMSSTLPYCSTTFYVLLTNHNVHVSIYEIRQVLPGSHAFDDEYPTHVGIM